MKLELCVFSKMFNKSPDMLIDDYLFSLAVTWSSYLLCWRNLEYLLNPIKANTVTPKTEQTPSQTLSLAFSTSDFTTSESSMNRSCQDLNTILRP